LELGQTLSVLEISLELSSGNMVTLIPDTKQLRSISAYHLSSLDGTNSFAGISKQNIFIFLHYPLICSEFRSHFVWCSFCVSPMCDFYLHNINLHTI